MNDYIVDNVRKIRKEIENENNGNWDQLERYFKEKQEHHKGKIYKGTAKKLPERNVVHNL